MALSSAQIAAKRNKPARYFKFWYETKSTNVVMTDIMNEDEAIVWLKGNEYAIVAMQVNERTTAEKLLRQIQPTIRSEEE